MQALPSLHAFEAHFVSVKCQAAWLDHSRRFDRYHDTVADARDFAGA